ncbi:MAG: hypothetical protein IBJ18_00800 [Phycisphaerales bacterium]|nr:hypothetical protein [Phycisphaerales bacterium]
MKLLLWKRASAVGDDRGGSFDLDASDAAWREEIGRDGDDEVKEIWRRKMIAQSSLTSKVDIAWVVIGAVVLLPVVLVIVWVTETLKLNSWVGTAVLVLFAISAFHFVRTWVLREKIIRSRITLLTYYRRCPQCVSRLEGLVVDEADGCVKCPECACSWKASRFGGDEVIRELRESVLRFKGAEVVAGERPDAAVEKTVDPVLGPLRRWLLPGMVVTDAHDRAVKLCRADLMDVPSEHRDAVEPVRRERLLEAAGSWKRRCAHGLAGTLLLAFFGWAQYSSLSRSWQLLPGSTLMEIGEKAVRIFAFFLMMALYGSMLWRVFVRSRPLSRKEFARAMVGEGLCPSCAGRLTRLRRDDEGVAGAGDEREAKWVQDCPKCRAVWGVDS